MYLAIAGNIGAGKTTLAQRLAQHYHWEISYESVDNNPYLADFYEDMPRWAFHLQIYFLNSRFNQVLNVKHQARPSVLDRTIYEDAHVFARNLHQSGLMSARDYENYLEVYRAMIPFVQAPELLIYLRAGLPRLRARIQQRGRDFEANISDEYLLNLNDHYEDWIASYDHGKILIVDISEVDLREDSVAWQDLIRHIDTHLGGQCPTNVA